MCARDRQRHINSAFQKHLAIPDPRTASDKVGARQSRQSILSQIREGEHSWSLMLTAAQEVATTLAPQFPGLLPIIEERMKRKVAQARHYDKSGGAEAKKAQREAAQQRAIQIARSGRTPLSMKTARNIVNTALRVDSLTKVSRQQLGALMHKYVAHRCPPRPLCALTRPGDVLPHPCHTQAPDSAS